MKGLFNWLNKTKVFRGLSAQEFSWVLYDVGNSAYTMLACSLITIWFKFLAVGEGPGQITQGMATSFWSYATSFVTIAVAVIGPICGALADRKDMKKIFFTTTVSAGVIGCILNGFAWQWIAFLVIFVLTKILYSASNTFYDSMLNDITTEERMDEVSSYGYAWGYIGSCIPFILALIAYVLGPDMLKVIPQQASMAIGFAVTAIWWGMVSLPLLKNYKQLNYVEKQKASVSMVFKKLGGTIKKIALTDRKVLQFLIAFFLYIDGVGTIIDQSVNIGTAKGLNNVGLVVLLLATQVVAWIGSLVFAKLSKKYKTVPLILVCIAGYFGVAIYALFLNTLIDFAILAFFVGCFQGSIQSLSRSYYSKIIPPENSGEYFGIYDIFSKGASFLGSLLIGVITGAGGSINIAVASLAVFFALGFVFLILASKQKSLNRTAQE